MSETRDEVYCLYSRARSVFQSVVTCASVPMCHPFCCLDLGRLQPKLGS